MFEEFGKLSLEGLNAKAEELAKARMELIRTM